MTHHPQNLLSRLSPQPPLPFEAAPIADKEPATAAAALGADVLGPDEDEEPSADDEVDLPTGDDDLGVETTGADDES